MVALRARQVNFKKVISFQRLDKQTNVENEAGIIDA